MTWLIPPHDEAVVAEILRPYPTTTMTHWLQGKLLEERRFGRSLLETLTECPYCGRRSGALSLWGAEKDSRFHNEYQQDYDALFEGRRFEDYVWMKSSHNDEHMFVETDPGSGLRARMSITKV